MRLRILYQQYGVAIFIRRGRASARHLARLIDGEGSVARNGVSIRSHRLTQRILFAGLQAFDDVRLLAGDPLFNDLAVLVDDLDCRAGQLLAVRDVHLADFNMRLRILYQQHGVAIFIRRGRASTCHLASLIDGEGGVARDRVSVRSHRLTQRVLFADVQTCYSMRFSGRNPLFNNVSFLVQDLDRCSGQFLAIRNINLAYLHFEGLVGERYLCACLIRRRYDSSLTIIYQCYSNGFSMSIIRNGLVVALYFGNRIDERTLRYVVKRIADLIEGHSAVRCIRLGLQQRAGGIL